MAPSKSSGGKRSKGRQKKAKPVRRAKPVSKKKAGSKKAARKTSRTAVPAVARRKGQKPADTVDTLGDWQHDHEVDTEHYTEDDIPPDYGGSE